MLLHYKLNSNVKSNQAAALSVFYCLTTVIHLCTSPVIQLLTSRLINCKFNSLSKSCVMFTFILSTEFFI